MGQPELDVSGSAGFHKRTTNVIAVKGNRLLDLWHKSGCRHLHSQVRDRRNRSCCAHLGGGAYADQSNFSNAKHSILRWPSCSALTSSWCAPVPGDENAGVDLSLAGPCIREPLSSTVIFSPGRGARTQRRGCKWLQHPCFGGVLSQR